MAEPAVEAKPLRTQSGRSGSGCSSGDRDEERQAEVPHFGVVLKFWRPRPDSAAYGSSITAGCWVRGGSAGLVLKIFDKSVWP
jgi:hypothetical protein